MNKYAYYRESIDCPECGFATHELYHAVNPNGQQALLCEACFDDKHENGTEYTEHFGLDLQAERRREE